MQFLPDCEQVAQKVEGVTVLGSFELRPDGNERLSYDDEVLLVGKLHGLTSDAALSSGGLVERVCDDSVFFGFDGVAQFFPKLLEVSVLQPAFKKTVLDTCPVVLTNLGNSLKAPRVRDVVGDEVKHFLGSGWFCMGLEGHHVLPPVRRGGGLRGLS